MNVAVDKSWLFERLSDEQIRIIDCRFQLGNPQEGALQYRKSHIPGAFYFDLEKQLSGLVSTHGGRHPLPDIDQLRAELEKAGIDHSKTVVAYDGGEGQFASRFWWLLRYMGHEHVYVLNQGFAGWEEAGYPTTQEEPESQSAQFEVKLQKDMLASYEEVKDIVMRKKKSPILMDSRDRARYLGETEPIDRIPGHIPGAIHLFWGDGLNKGSYKNSDEQKERFEGLDQEQPIIVYCGSGVTAAPNYIALKLAGFRNVKLYAGSYSDWVSYEGNPVSRGEEPKK